MLRRTATGFGALAAAALFAEGSSPHATAGTSVEPFAPRDPHFLPKARNVIFLYMDGGPSQVDSFDPKPTLDREHGKPFPLDIDKKTLQFDNMGLTLKSLWPFKQHGESGLPVSGLFPEIAKHVDKILEVVGLKEDSKPAPTPASKATGASCREADDLLQGEEAASFRSASGTARSGGRKDKLCARGGW